MASRGVYIGAVMLTVVSSACALAALAVGSPLQFGVALALCAAGWIATDFAQRTVEPTQFTRRCAVVRVRVNPGHGSGRVVYAGGHARFARPVPSTVTQLAA